MSLLQQSTCWERTRPLPSPWRPGLPTPSVCPRGPGQGGRRKLQEERPGKANQEGSSPPPTPVTCTRPAIVCSWGGRRDRVPMATPPAHFRRELKMTPANWRAGSPGRAGPRARVPRSGLQGPAAGASLGPERGLAGACPRASQRGWERRHPEGPRDTEWGHLCPPAPPAAAPSPSYRVPGEVEQVSPAPRVAVLQRPRDSRDTAGTETRARPPDNSTESRGLS